MENYSPFFFYFELNKSDNQRIILGRSVVGPEEVFSSKNLNLNSIFVKITKSKVTTPKLQRYCYTVYEGDRMIY